MKTGQTIWMTAALVYSLQATVSFADESTVAAGNEAAVATTLPYATAGALGSGALTSALIAYNRFSAKDVLIKQTAVPVITHRTASEIRPSDLSRVSRKLRDGDSVVVQFELTEAESRPIRIAEADLAAKQARLMAHWHRTEAAMNRIRITRVEYYRDRQGVEQPEWVVKGPDFDTANAHAAVAEDKDVLAKHYEELAEGYRRGKPVELVVRVGEIETLNGRATNVDSFLKDRMLNQHRLISVSRVPKASVMKAKSLSRGGWLGVAGAVVLSAGMLTEIVADFPIANEVNVRIFAPPLATADLK